MASEHYVKSIHEMQEYFGISKVCAQYLFHRALQARKTYEKQVDLKKISKTNVLISSNLT